MLIYIILIKLLRYLVQQGCITPLCDLLTCKDNKIIQREEIIKNFLYTSKSN